MPQNLKQLLLDRSDWFARKLMEHIKETEFAYLTPAQSRLLTHMGGKPMSMAGLARKLAISRQAVHKTVVELSRRGILELRDDPDRGNAKLVYYTDKGRDVNRAGAQMINRLEQQIASRIGRDELLVLKKLLGDDWD